VTGILEQVWPVYEAETRDQLQALAAGVMELEATTLPEVVTRLRRVAHSLKGSAAAIGLLDIERVAHAVEDVLALADGGRPLPAAAVEAALGAVSAIGEALTAEPPGRIGPLDQVLARLSAVLGQPRAPAAGPAGQPAPRQGSHLEVLAAMVGALCTADGAERAGHAATARLAAERLAATLAGRAAELARGVAEAAAALEAPDADVARAVARAGAELVALRGELARTPAPLPGPPQAAAGRPGAAPRAPQPARDERLVRVDATRLDTVANDVDQLIVGVARRERRSREAQALDKALRETLRLLERGAAECGLQGDVRGHPLAHGLERLRAHGLELGRHAREARRDSEQERLLAQGLRGKLQALRMVPAGAGLAWVRPAVRELASQLGKDVAVSLAGGELRLDRRILDELKPPLLHLLRNALDHGIEPPAARREAGKPEQASLELRVEPRGDRVLVTVRDDGAGLSPGRLREAAVRRGLTTLAEAERLSDAEAVRLAFRPGLSTASEVTAVSGRGVGLDVVAETVRRLGGDVDVTFQPGQGTAFVLEVPLTISGATGLLVRAAGGLALLPADAVERVLLVAEGDLTTFAGGETVEVDGTPVPFTTMDRALGGGGAAATTGFQVALLLASGGRRVAVAVDEVLGSHAILVSPLGPRLAGARHLAGAAVLDDGRVVAVLQPAQLIGQRRQATPSEGPRRARVIVADDSLSTRMTVKHLLEVAGFVVLPAADGEEALALAREGGCDLVVSDVQMPRLDGLGLTRRLKADPALARIPVILVTSLGRPEDHAAGLEAGADGYVVKGDVQRGRLLELVRRLLPP
jgi:two-component system, chemotaxis family, sensor kinase CheA